MDTNTKLKRYILCPGEHLMVPMEINIVGPHLIGDSILVEVSISNSNTWHYDRPSRLQVIARLINNKLVLSARGSILDHHVGNHRLINVSDHHVYIGPEVYNKLVDSISKIGR